MASLPNAKGISYDEWLRMPEVGDAVEEVVDGEIRIMPAPKWKHSRIVQNLYDLIRPQVDQRQVIIAISQFGLIIRREPLTSRVPDLAMFHRDSIVEQDGYIHSTPQLVVEVLSPANNRQEREEKLADYASPGVPEVWMVSPEARTVELLHLESGSFERAAILAAGILKPRQFPHVQIDIAEIWPD